MRAGRDPICAKGPQCDGKDLSWANDRSSMISAPIWGGRWIGSCRPCFLARIDSSVVPMTTAMCQGGWHGEWKPWSAFRGCGGGEAVR
jgi:hypothetical protein